MNLRRIAVVALSLVAIVGCEEAIVETVTSNTSVADAQQPGREGAAGSSVTGGLAGTAWRVTTPHAWPDVMIVVAFGSTGRYSVEPVAGTGVLPWGTDTEINTIQLSGDWSLRDGLLTVEANGPELSGAFRRIDTKVLCWDLPGEEPCGVILVRVQT